MIIKAFLSIIANIVISILGVVPSFFITAFNVSTFGLFYGFIVSLVGESLGAIVSFYLYRKGFKQVSQSTITKYSKINDIINSEKKDQFLLVMLMRIFPYVPSGVVTYGAAISNMDIKNFTIASTIGKIPAMVIEVLITFGFVAAIKMQQIQILLLLISIVGIIVIITKLTKRGK